MGLIELSHIDHLHNAGYPVKINDQDYRGHYAIGDTLEVNGITYIILGINEDAIVVKPLK